MQKTLCGRTLGDVVPLNASCARKKSQHFFTRRWSPHDLNFHPKPTTMGCAAPKGDGPLDAAGLPLKKKPPKPRAAPKPGEGVPPLYKNDSPPPKSEMRENTFRKLVYKD